MKRLLTVIGSTLLLLLASCAAPVESGVVVDKQWQDWYYTYDQCYSYNQDGTCANYGPRFHPAEYDLKVEGKTSEGELVTRWISVSETVYYSCDVGMRYVKGGQCE